MKKLLLLIGMLFSATLVFAEKNLAVSTFDISNNAVTKDEAEAITELYIAELVEIGKLKVIDRANFDKILQEMNFQESDWSNAKKTTELGNVTNVELIARGKIIKLGTKMYLSATVIDVKTANIITSSRKQFDSVDDIFDLLTDFSKELVKNIQNENIGKVGKGGGIIFYVEGKRCFECSEILGQVSWSEAKSICSEYRGGGFEDWYLPSLDELENMYHNLKEKNLIQGGQKYWSSAKEYDNWAFALDFSNGVTVSECTKEYFARGGRKYYPYYGCVRAVRSYINEE